MIQTSTVSFFTVYRWVCTHTQHSFNIEIGPDWSADLREPYPQITGVFHMNKTHWNSVLTDGLKRNLINLLTKKAKDGIENSPTWFFVI
ncbi:MmcQ/YjbR family DNA-binding protein [Chryseobacterium sp. Leaf201]|uniref:MmcQ/YjbR family DNA-binding protein n=1 Tax=Chryseobacterium sp. Leaf201 TaxID=1735672 RepID=UPI0009E9C867|nr:MmcQ/YjbR family DNA-binding protein [Chryseobacterium sp. Leaf201]